MVRAGRSIPLPAPRRRRIPWTALLIVAALIAVLFWGAEPAGRRRPEPFPLTRAERDGLKLMDAPMRSRSSEGVRGGSAPMGEPMRSRQMPGAPGSAPMNGQPDR